MKHPLSGEEFSTLKSVVTRVNSADSCLARSNIDKRHQKLDDHRWGCNIFCRMSVNNLGLIPAGNWRGGNGHGDSSSDDRDPYQNRRNNVPPSIYYPPEEERGLFAPWRLFEERVRTGPYGLTRFPSPPHSPVRILVLNTGGPWESLSPRLRQFIQDSPLRSRDQWRHESEEPAGLTDEEFKKAMKTLRKEVYNRGTKNARKKGLFGNWNNNKEKTEVKKGEENACPVCLEMFATNQQVLVTQCNHMFHEDCIVPWVKSNGHCPVCRFAFCKRVQAVTGTGTGRTVATTPQNYNQYSLGEENLLPVDLISLIRAMEEAFNWVTLTR